MNDFLDALTGKTPTTPAPTTQPAGLPVAKTVSANPSAVNPVKKAYIQSRTEATPTYNQSPSGSGYSGAAGANTTTTNTTTTPPPDSPPPKQDTTATDAFTKAYKAYQDAQLNNSDVTSAKTLYNDFVANLSKSKSDLEGRGLGTPISIVRGEQAKLLSQNQAEEARLQGDVNIAQDAQTSKENAAKTGFEATKDLLTLNKDANKPIVVDGVAYSQGSDGKLTPLTTKTQSPTDLYGTGSIGEYNFAKSQGYKGSFTDYQNEDANRKAKANSTGTGSEVYVEGQNPSVDAWITRINNGQATITQAPANLKNLITQGLSGSGQQANALVSDAFTSAKSLLDSFSSNDNTKGILPVGFSSFLPVIPGTKSADFVRNFENLKSLLSLDNVKYLKGQGSVSDAERKLLADSATKLDRSQSPAEFQKTLQGIVTTLQSKTAGKASGESGVTPSGITYTVIK